MNLIDLFKFVQKIPGAVGIAEMAALYDAIESNLCSNKGIVVDFGAHAGKTSCVASAAISSLARSDLFCLVDPVYDLTNEEAWKDTIQGSSEKMPWGYCRELDFKEKVLDRMRRFSNLEHKLYGITSLQFLAQTDFRFSYVFIDSDDHQPELVLAEVKALEDRILKGGLIFFHDFKNQYIGPVQAHEYLISTGKFEEVKMDWDFAVSFSERYDLEKENDTWQNYDQIATFVGGVKRL